MMKVHTILYVANQNKSRDFYEKFLNRNPSLDVPGMTEFDLSEQHVLGIMPQHNIKKLLGGEFLDISNEQGLKAELYFRMGDPETAMKRAIECGATYLSPLTDRDWGMKAGYVMDPDGYIIGISS